MIFFIFDKIQETQPENPNVSVIQKLDFGCLLTLEMRRKSLFTWTDPINSAN